jgi:hypothetical protein
MKLHRPQTDLWDVMGAAGVLLLATGLAMFSLPLCVCVLGVGMAGMSAWASWAEAKATRKQQPQRPPIDVA